MTQDQQRSDDRYPFPWSLPDDAADREGAAEHPVIDLAQAHRHTDPAAHCPACGSRYLDVVTVPDKGRYDRCTACGRLWAVHDGSMNLVLDAEITHGDT